MVSFSRALAVLRSSPHYEDGFHFRLARYLGAHLGTWVFSGGVSRCHWFSWSFEFRSIFAGFVLCESGPRVLFQLRGFARAFREFAGSGHMSAAPAPVDCQATISNI